MELKKCQLNYLLLNRKINNQRDGAVFFIKKLCKGSGVYELEYTHKQFKTKIFYWENITNMVYENITNMVKKISQRRKIKRETEITVLEIIGEKIKKRDRENWIKNHKCNMIGKIKLMTKRKFTGSFLSHPSLVRAVFEIIFSFLILRRPS